MPNNYRADGVVQGNTLHAAAERRRYIPSIAQSADEAEMVVEAVEAKLLIEFGDDKWMA